MKETIAEEALVVAAQHGDLGAFNQLVLAYQGLAYSVARHILVDADAAADATQDGFLKAFRALKSYRGGSFKAWLMRIVTNSCYDQLRSRRRRQTTSLDDTEDPESALQLVDKARGPADIAESHELRRIIRTGMRALPADQRTVMILSDIEGLSYDEIAQATGMAMGTVKSRLSRARAKMRDYLVLHRDLVPYRISAAEYRA